MERESLILSPDSRPRPRHPSRGAPGGFCTRTLAAALLAVVASVGIGSLGGCTPAATPVQQENALPGTPQSVWDVAGEGDPTIQGFATQSSVNKGETLELKISTDAAAYEIDIYRLGHYQGNGARLVATILPSAPLPQTQPPCLDDVATGLVDCGNWSVSASWPIPTTVVSGVYLARPRRTDTQGASHIPFVVRDDSRKAPIVVQTSDTTWQAWNDWGGASLHSGPGPAGRAYRVSYNRPLRTRAIDDGRHHFFNAEYPLIRWLEWNGYDVDYVAGVDVHRSPALLTGRKVFISSGEDSYWSAEQRANVEAAWASGVNLAFLSSKKLFWKSRFEASIDGSATAHRTLVSYRETLDGAVIDPAAPVWTGTWRDARFSPPGDAGLPENALAGTLFSLTDADRNAIEVAYEQASSRLWRGTAIAQLAPGNSATLAPGTLGEDVDLDVDNGSRPGGLVGLSSTPVTTASGKLLDEGASYGAGSGTHRLTLHRHPTSGAFAFSAGTSQWAWGLDATHDRSALGATTDLRMHQATINLLHDLGVTPAIARPGLAVITRPADVEPPTTVVASPAPGASVLVGSQVVVSGTASDAMGIVAGVEVSIDGGLSWHPAEGRESWSYVWTPVATGPTTILARAADDLALLGAASDPVVVSVDPPAPVSVIAQENALAGTPASEWDIVGIGDPSIQGFATEFSIDKGETLSFKIDTDASDYSIEIYRLGYYQGDGARLVATVIPSPTLPQLQPDCLNDTETGLIDCGNWAVSATWAVPSTAVSGVYIARLERTDTGGASHVPFIVRDDARVAAIVFQTADTTWQAYNDYGGNSLYVGSPNGRARKVSYNRPFTTRNVDAGVDYLWNGEYPMLRWLEANGYDVQYISGIDTDRDGSLLLGRKVYLSNGHDEYWSAAQRTNVETALTAGVNLGFFSGNKIFWKTRFEPSIDGSGTPYRTLVCYKETHSGVVTDPAHPVWTGTWRDARFSPPADGGRPENALGGSIFMVNGEFTGAITVSGEEGRMRLWRGTSLATLPLGDTATLAPGSLGAELDVDLDNGSRPPGLVGLSSTPIVTGSLWLQDEGSTFGPGSGTHKLTLHRNPTSDAAVFSTGTYQWSWGLDATHDRAGLGATTDVRMQQATVNLFADLGVEPASLQPGLALLPIAPDTTPPTATIGSPTPGANLEVGVPTTVAGTAADVGGVVGGVEVSVDGGATWHPAAGRESWSYSWTPSTPGAATLLARAADDSARLGVPSAPIAVTLGSAAPCTANCSIFAPGATPTILDDGTSQPVELGVKFRSSTDGFVEGIRFYKAATSTGAHGVNLWTAAGALLASAPLTNGTESGWQQVSFAAPVPIAANTVYVASYHGESGRYVRDEAAFTSAAISRPPLEALASGVATGPNGVFGYGPAGSFPTEGYLDSNYFVDVVFDPASLVSIAISPADPSIAFGATQAFQAIGTYSDASTFDLSAEANWASSNASVATVAAGGLATGAGGGTATITATVGAVVGSTSITVAPPPPSITTASLPAAAVGVAYSATLAGVGGTPPYVWSIGGTLPPGLTLNPTSGTISGIPTATGSYALSVELTDAALATALAALSIDVAAAPLVALQVSPDPVSIPAGATQQFTATGTYADLSTQDLSALVVWGSASSSVLSIDSAGLATAIGPGTSQVTATLGAISDTALATVEPGPDLAVLTSSLPSATVTVPYQATLAASGGTPPYTWSVSGSLPPGLTLDPNTGIISGTPTTSVLTSFLVVVTDSASATASRPLNISVAPAPLIAIGITPADPIVPAGSTQAFVATGTYADATLRDVSSEVSWASTNAAVATIAPGGLATAVGAGVSTISAALGEVSAETTLTVVAPPIEITTTSLPDASFGMPYLSPPLAAIGGTPPYTWSIASGLPPGLSIDPVTGVISGTPTAGGVFSFLVTVTDSALLVGSRTLEITVPELANFTIWPESVPIAVTDSGDPGSVELGIKFRSSEAGFVTGIRFYKSAANVGTHVGSLWSESGTLLATATFTNETESGWQQVDFGAPVPIAANTVYVASYFAPAGRYSVDEQYFSSGQGFDNPPLRALSSAESGGNGVYSYAPASSFPTETYLGSNYWVDIVFAGEPPPALESITVTPASPVISTGGGAQPFSATGTYADSSTVDLTSQVVWASSSPAVATVSGTGLATAGTPGTTTISATLGAVSGTASLTVELGTLSVATASLAPGTQGTPYTAILVPLGGLSPYTWSVVGALPDGLSLDPSTGVISGTPTTLGTFPFTAEVVDSSAQSASAGLSIEIAAVPVLSSISVTPSTPTLARGATQALTVTGTLSNGTTQNVTTQVVWSSSVPSVGRVDSSGVATAFNPGTSTLTATLGAVSGSATLTATAAPPQATEGPGGPILIVTHPGNPYGRFLAEIVRAEGFMAFSAMDVDLVNPAVLASHDVVLLAEFPLTAAQAAMFDAYVATGGNLVAMRPDPQLAATLGLQDLSATLSNAYLQVSTASGPGAGIVGETIQYKGTADLYALDGAGAVATLYATATTPTAAPAVTLHGSLLGKAAAFTYDLARSVAWARQGNPAWSGTSRSGTNPIRSVELYFGSSPTDPQPDWVDFDKVAIPQADEQQRLLANLILQMSLPTLPLPRFWYLPSGHEAAIVMTGDDHNNQGTAARFNSYLAESTPGCSVENWECVRSTSYIYVGSLSTAQAQFYESQGFEVSLHVDTGCANWVSPTALSLSYGVQLGVFEAAYPGVSAPSTNRTHCVVWSDYDTQPQVELASGIRLDTTYYYFPGSWVGDRPGFMTGSGIPMRFVDRRGATIDVWQAATHMTDESSQTYPFTVDTLLDNALGPAGYYGVFTANMHTDSALPVGPGAGSWVGSYAIVDSAQARGVPIVSARQMLEWLDGRDASTFGSITFDGALLDFSVTAAPGANNLRGMLPLELPGKTLTALTRDGSPISFTTRTIKGVVYAMFPATTGAYEATYQ